MKKPTQKRINECLKDIEFNFKELVDAIIWYEKNDMDDWATDIVGEVERISSDKEINLLIKDLKNRNNEDFEVYSYQRLWWALINTQSEDINAAIIQACKEPQEGQKLIDGLNNWMINLDDDIDTKENIKRIINKTPKSRL